MKKQLLLLTIFLSAIICSIQAQTVLWADAYGGNDTDVGNAVAVDASGNTYITGTFKSPTLDFGSGVILTNTGNNDMFVAKFNSSGNIVWAENASGTGDEIGHDITIDPSTGDVYVIGSFSGGSITFGTLSPLPSSGGSDIYIVKINSTGTPQWSVGSTGGSSDEFGNAIKYFSGNVYAVGSFESSSFSLGGITATNSNPPFSDVFVTCLNAAGTTSWIKVPKGDENDYGIDIDVCSVTGDIYITGYFSSSILEFLSGVFTLTNTGNYDAFIARYTPGGICNWAINPTGTKDDFSRGIAVDAAGDAYITGNFFSPSLSLGGVSVSNSGSLNSDYFVAKCSPSSTSFIWAQSANGNYYPQWNFDDVGKSLVLDNCGNLYVTGWYNSFVINFGTGFITNATNNNYSELFVAKYNSSTGNILQLFQGHEVMNDQGMDVAVNDCTCPVVTGWFNDKLNLSGTYLSHVNPVGTSDLYVGQICNDTCSQPCDYPIEHLNTGDGIPIGGTDANWVITSWPAGINPTSVVACPWFGSSGPIGWSYHPPLPGTQWISVYDSAFTTPQAPTGIYKFKRKFSIDSLQCENPILTLCILVDDTAAIYLNGSYIGKASSLSTPTTLSVSGYGPFINGTNTLEVVVNNLIDNQMAFDLWGSVCCNSNQNTICDSLWVSYEQTDTCCDIVTLTNAASSITIDNIQFSTALGNTTLLEPITPTGWLLSPAAGYPVSSFMLFPFTPGSFSNSVTVCVAPDPANNPQQINIVWMGFDNNNDTVWCYDTLNIYCPYDTLVCDSCDNILQTIKTGVTPPVWTLLSAPSGSGITTGVPATNVPSIISPWRAPFPGSQWISYSLTGGGWLSSVSAPLGEYHYQTQFCICDTCVQGEKLSLHYCILSDDTAELRLNGTTIGISTSQTTPTSEIVHGPFLIGGVNTLDVYVKNNPAYFTGFDLEAWLCCDNPNGINQTEFDDKVKLFPNPVSQYVYLKSTVLIHSIEIYSLFGQRVTSAKVNDYHWDLNTNNLTSGLYFVKINTESGVINKRMIVKH